MIGASESEGDRLNAPQRVERHERLQSTFRLAVLPCFDMSSMTMQSARSLTETAEEAVHVWRHRGLAVSMGLGYAIWRRLLQPNTPALERETVETLAKRFERLLQQDLANARAGYYPRSLLHQFPLFEYLLRMPEALLELPRVLLRSYRGRYDDLPAEAKPRLIPGTTGARFTGRATAG